jgi:hypothetical protein
LLHHLPFGASARGVYVLGRGGLFTGEDNADLTPDLVDDLDGADRVGHRPVRGGRVSSADAPRCLGGLVPEVGVYGCRLFVAERDLLVTRDDGEPAGTVVDARDGDGAPLCRRWWPRSVCC